MAPKQLRAHYPQAVPWVYAHPALSAFWFTLTWIVLVVIVAVLVDL